jgi:hypothetical protein
MKKLLKKVKKIKPEGPFGGKNRQLLDADGNAVTDAMEAMKEE